MLSMCAGYAEAVHAIVTWEIGASSKDVACESSGCIAIAYKSVIATHLRGSLLSHFGKSLAGRATTNVEEQNSPWIFDTSKHLMKE